MSADPGPLADRDIEHLLDLIVELLPEQVPDAIASLASPLVEGTPAIVKAVRKRLQHAPSHALQIFGAWLQTAGFIAPAFWEREPTTGEEVEPRRLSTGGQAFLRSVVLGENELLRSVPAARLSSAETLRLAQVLIGMVERSFGDEITDARWFELIGAIAVRALVWGGPGTEEARRELGHSLGILGTSLLHLGRSGGVSAEPLLDRAASVLAWADLALADVPEMQAGYRMSWANVLETRFELFGGSLEQHLERALELYEVAEPQLEQQPEDQGKCRINWATALRIRYQASGGSDLQHLERALELYALAEPQLKEYPETQASCRMNWAAALQTRYQGSGGLLQHLERALELYALAEPQFENQPMSQAGCRVNWATALQIRFRAPGGSLEQHLERAVALYALAEPQLSGHPEEQAVCRVNWATALLTRHEASGGSLHENLERALELYSLAELQFQHQPVNQANCRVSWAAALLTRYEASDGSLNQHLERALDLYAQAEPQLAGWPADQASCRMHWANALQTRYETPGGSLEHLERALKLYEQAESQFAGLPESQAGCQVNWANALQIRYQAPGGSLEQHLEVALKLYALAEPQLSSRPEDQANCRMNWATVLRIRYQASSGRLRQHLDRALELYALAEPQFEHQPVNQAKCRMNWAGALYTRYQAPDGSVNQHLERALDLYAQAEPQFEHEPVSQAGCRLNWATALQVRYQVSGGSLERHLERALALYAVAEPQLGRRALEQATCRLNWANALQIRYQAPGGNPQHLMQAQRLAWQALEVANDRNAVDLQLRARISLARTAVVQDDPAAAAEVLRPAQDLLEGALLLVPHEVDQDRLLDEHASAIDLLLHSLVTLHDAAVSQHQAGQGARCAEEIWQVCVRRTARHTVQNLLTSVLDNTSPDAINQAFVRLAVARRQQALLAQALSTLDGPTSPASSRPANEDEHLRQERRAADLEVAVAERALLELDPSLRRLVRVEMPELATVQHALATIRDGAAMLQLVPMRDQVLLLVLSGTGLHLRSLPVAWRDLADSTLPLLDALWGPSDQELDAFEELLYEAAATMPGGVLAERQVRLDRFRTARAQAENRLLDLEALGPLLWAELEPLLPRVTSDALASGRVPHLFLVPGGPFQLWPLWMLPLHAASDAAPDSGVERLGDRYACSLLPAPDALPALLAQQPADGPLQAFAPPTNLTFARAQACFEARVTGGSVYLDDQASFDTLRGLQGGAVGLYTHARFDLQSPHRSGIVLARAFGPEGDAIAVDPAVHISQGKPHDVPASSPSEPELVTMASRDGVDILSARLEMVSALQCALGLAPGSLTWIHLLACGTHIGGGSQQGERWTGLTAAFLRVAPQLLATLWRVDDLAAAVLSVPYQAALANGATLPQALRQAVRGLRMADREQLTAWVAELRASVPDSESERTRFDTAWKARQQHLPPVGPSFPLPLWAPFIAIGAPCSRSAIELPPDSCR